MFEGWDAPGWTAQKNTPQPKPPSNIDGVNLNGPRLSPFYFTGSVTGGTNGEITALPTDARGDYGVWDILEAAGNYPLTWVLDSGKYRMKFTRPGIYSVVVDTGGTIVSGGVHVAGNFLRSRLEYNDGIQPIMGHTTSLEMGLIGGTSFIGTKLNAGPIYIPQAVVDSADTWHLGVSTLYVKASGSTVLSAFAGEIDVYQLDPDNHAPAFGLVY